MIWIRQCPSSDHATTRNAAVIGAFEVHKVALTMMRDREREGATTRPPDRFNGPPGHHGPGQHDHEAGVRQMGAIAPRTQQQ